LSDQDEIHSPQHDVKPHEDKDHVKKSLPVSTKGRSSRGVVTEKKKTRQPLNNHSVLELSNQGETQAPQHSESIDHPKIRVVDVPKKAGGLNKPALLVPGRKRFPLIVAHE